MRVLRSIAAVLALAAAMQAVADHPLPLWQVDGDANRIYLLGSVHLLRESDYPLPDGIESAYDDAETLIMEIDMDDLDPAAAQALVAELGQIADGRTLADLLGPSAYEEANTRAATVGIPLALLNGVEPWLAAISIEQLMLQRLGFDPEIGIEAHLSQRATDDEKPVEGLEELAQQLGFLDSLSTDAQRALLLQTLAEAARLEPMMDSMIAAWRHGDVAWLEEHVLDELKAHPELYDAIVVRRNRDWTRQIAELLDDEDDYLIVVGALHLVGPDGLPASLRELGYEARQVNEEP